MQRSVIPAVVTAAILASTALASAQVGGNAGNAGGGTVGPSGVIMSPGVPPSAGSTSTPGTTGLATQPSVSTPTTSGRVGTSSPATALPGDNPSAPGFPGKVGG
jgi:hypothetical protein